MKVKISVTTEDDGGVHQVAYDNTAAFLVTCQAHELTTALAAVLDVDRHALANVIPQVQFKALREAKEKKEASAG